MYVFFLCVCVPLRMYITIYNLKEAHHQNVITSFPQQLQEDKIRALQEKVELSEQKLAQYAKLPDVEQELKQRMEALHQVSSVRRQVDNYLFLESYILLPVRVSCDYSFYLILTGCAKEPPSLYVLREKNLFGLMMLCCSLLFAGCYLLLILFIFSSPLLLLLL